LIQVNCDNNLDYTAGKIAWGSDGNIVRVGDIEKQIRQTPMAEDTMLIEIEAIAYIGE
jgi:enamine deaminase RidA (YjgF/YER057c/UK114 family)